MCDHLLVHAYKSERNAAWAWGKFTFSTSYDRRSHFPTQIVGSNT